MMKKIFVLSLAFLLAACATAPAVRQIQNAFPIEKPFDSVWQATIETFSDLSLPIQNMEKASGLITTDWVSFRGQKNETGYCDCGKPQFPFGETNRAGKFNVYVKKAGESSCEVRINAVFEMTAEYQENSRKSSCVSTGRLETRMFELIAEKLK